MIQPEDMLKTDAQIIEERVRRGVENGKTLIELEAQLLDEARKKYANDPDSLFEMEKNIREVIFNEKDRGETQIRRAYRPALGATRR